MWQFLQLKCWIHHLDLLKTGLPFSPETGWNQPSPTLLFWCEKNGCSCADDIRRLASLGNHGTGRPFVRLVSVPECVWISFSLPKSTGRNDIKLGSNCVPIRNDDWERTHVLQRSCIRNHQLGVYLVWGPLWRARGCGRYDIMIYIYI